MDNLRWVDREATKVAAEVDGKTIVFDAKEGNRHWESIKGQDLSGLPGPSPAEQLRRDLLLNLKTMVAGKLREVSDALGDLPAEFGFVYFLKYELVLSQTDAKAKALLERNAAGAGKSFDAHMLRIAEKRFAWIDRVMEIDDAWESGRRALEAAPAEEAALWKAFDTARSALVNVGG